ncbi:MAG: tetratricopeptide repeat protein [Gammaproteobacteria bacterium]|nr:tetratricopeptide repeat protein [Gammaproteobacteria bacterium]
MSVINTMLKDLEKREKHFADNNAILHGLKSRASQSTPSAPNSHTYIITLIAIGLMIALMAAIYFISPYRLTKPESPAEPNANTAPAIPAEITVAHPDQDSVPAPAIAANETQMIEPAQTSPDTPEPVIATPVIKPVTVNSAAQTTKPAVIAHSITAQPTNTLAATTQAPAASDVNTDDDYTAANTNTAVNKKPVILSSEENSQQAYANALTQYNSGRTQAARDLLKDALIYNPKHSQARQLLAAINILEKRPDIALTIIEQGLAINPNDKDLLRVYLQALVQLENYSKAIAIMETHLQASGPDDMAYLAGLYQKNKQHMDAVKTYSQALRLIPGNSIWWMGQAISLEELGKPQQAIDSYQQSLDTDGLSSQLREFVQQRINSIAKQTSQYPR